MILPKLIWNSLNILIAQYNITKIQKKIVYISSFHNMINDPFFSSCTCMMVLTHMMVLRSCDLGPQVSQSSDHSL